MNTGTGHSQGGSGTPIHTEGGKSLILTNDHVVPPTVANASITVEISGNTYPAKYVTGTGGSPDLCLLSIDVEVMPVTIADSAPLVGEEVWQWGYGGVREVRNVPPIARGGNINPPNQFVTPTITASYIPVSGDSGSGVFNQKG